MKNVINAKDISAGEANILQLAEPENYRCLVHQLGRTYSGLRIDMKYLGDRSPDSNRYLFLQNIQYFEGSLAWVGANMQLINDESLALRFWNIRKGNGQDTLGEDISPKAFRFYEILTQGVTIRIIAGTTLILSSTPRLVET